MKMISFSLPVILLGTVAQMACASERILDVGRNKIITRRELLAVIKKSDELIVGEKHNTKSIQASEAKLLRDYAKLRGERVTFAWEFWDWSKKAEVDAAYAEFLSGKMTSEACLKKMFGEKTSNLTYERLLDVAKAARADILPTNLSREEKAPVLKAGIKGLDPKLLPAGFEEGGKNYYDRFVEAMGGHGDPKMIPNYFTAQSLVDDVVALHLARDRTTRSVFLVMGNFHTSYFDGVWRRTELRSGERLRTLVHIVNPEDQTDWEPVLHHKQYGNLADFVIFTN